ncbi:PTS sugar transporter subunit IIA [uncultured Trichococcus sp.]|jgi:PTS system galactitol-specific IIA component|uniref:PTS sugar transporter subunit IIA n=1 Tax=uncultured Trichococcus sp. TaxID=189665 RepID=UPI0029C8AD64|nr:PTS sugar transporter subunit IIA [uncultured Trichococcus sp.]
MEYSDLFDSKLIKLNQEFESQRELFEYVSDILEEENYTEDTFFDAIREREKVFPTGLQTDMVNLAIPHTDVLHVKRPFIFVVTLNKPIKFIQMGTFDEWVDIDTVFVLGIKEPQEQVGLLSNIMTQFRNKYFIDAFNGIVNISKMEELLKNEFGSVEV